MKKFLSHFSLYSANGLVYGLNSIYFGFIQIYVLKYHTADVAGVLLAIGPLVSIFAPIMWGYLADRARCKNSVLTAAILCSAVCYFMLMLDHSFMYLAVMLALTMFFMSPFASLLDIITLEYTFENSISYGPIRVIGTVIYGIIPMVLTHFTDRNINVIFFAYAAIALIAALSIASAPKIAGHSTAKKKTSFAPILKDGTLMLLIAIIAVAQFAWAYYGNFFPGYLNDLGYSSSVWGLNVFLTVLGEIPFFLAFNGLFQRLGTKKLMLLSLVLSIVRYIAMAAFTDAFLLLATGVVTGVAITVFIYCASVYISRHIAAENRASANSLMYGVGSGIPKVLAGLLGGTMTVNLGYQTSMLICGGLFTVAFILFLIMSKRLTALK